MAKPLLSLICALDKNRLIGNHNALPWHLPADLAWFKLHTLGKTVIMGRKTFESIGKALPNRQNIVISSKLEQTFPGCALANTIPEALALAENTDEIMLIGGASLFQQTIDQADRLYLTWIDQVFVGDTWFPDINLQAWEIITQSQFSSDAKNPYDLTFVHYRRARK